MCNCLAHREFVDCDGCACDHTGDRLLQLSDRVRALTAELDRLSLELTNGEATDGYHTHNELYEYRLLYNAHAALAFDHAGWRVVRSWKHSSGSIIFGGGWFVVHVETPAGQITNHYKAEHWHLFDGITEESTAPAWDHHTPPVAARRLEAAIAFLRQQFTEMREQCSNERKMNDER